MPTAVNEAVYAETSAVLGWLLGEPSSDFVIHALQHAKNVVSSTLTILEVERALVRAERTGILRSADRQTARRIFKQEAASWFLLEVTPAVRERAAREFAVEPIRSLDALHLATALEFVRAFDRVDVLSNDKRILDNLPDLGLTAVRP